MQTLPNLSPSITREVFANLCRLLPPPATNTTEARADREETAMAAVAALYPTDAFQALLAAQIVAADYHAKEGLRLAEQPGQDPKAAHQCRAQASTMMRHMQSGLRALQRTQEKWEKAEAERNPAAMERAGYWFKDVSVPLAEPTPAEAAVPEPIPPQPPATPFAELTEAEQYAVLYPDRAALIRAHGGLPPSYTFGPPEPELVADLVNGTSPILRALDHPPRTPAASIAPLAGVAP